MILVELKWPDGDITNAEDRYPNLSSVVEKVIDGNIENFHRAIEFLDSGYWIDVTEEILALVERGQTPIVDEDDCGDDWLLANPRQKINEHSTLNHAQQGIAR